ncbi:hypothetical protein [Peribacillus acanthi]|uniref:hypothetical protein n=1 Tax=Peribacillus acanthi TaxID=2171554 RepID=UPI000D3E4CCB|nr:hypothetical protein [Peribacillus acanthi]
MRHLPVYTLDLETRLTVDSIAFDSEEVEKSEMELLVFPIFREKIKSRLEQADDALKNSDHSLELLLLNRDIEVIMEVASHYESLLKVEFDFGTPYNDMVERNLAVYDMALRYRYALGLYETDESFSSYYSRKMGDFKDYLEDFESNYTLPTFIFPYDEIPDESRTEYVDELLDSLRKLSEKDERYLNASHEVQLHLMKLELPTKYDWSMFISGWRFGYLEQRAIQAEVIMHLKNGLREAYVEEYEWNIQKYIDALYVMYHHNLTVSGVEVEISLEDLPKMEYLDAMFIQSGILGGSMYHAADVYADNVRMHGTRGHGIAAERANHIIDQALFKDASILGDDNVKDGADRIVNGDYIQTKYCSTGGKCISECFEKGKFRYTLDGKPMQIEVPKDQYDQALQSMRDRIKNGDMEYLGITDPKEAEKIIRKGNITYKTAQRIAKAGTIEGITFDAAKGMVTGIQSFGISATISFATSIWRGEDADEALNQAMKDGSKIFGQHVMQHVLTQQIGRTAIEKSLRPATDYVVKNVLGSKTSAQIVNAFFRNAAGQAPIYGGAAMNHLSKLMRGNIVTMAITTVVLSTGSILDIVNGKISGGQFFKNIGTTGASVGGAAIGASIGSVVPVVGTFIVGVVGGVIGGKLSKKALDKVIDDDSIHTIEVLKEQFMVNIEELQLDRDELNFIANYIFDPKQLPKQLKNIYAASSSEEYISGWMDPYIEAVLKVRPRINDIGQLIEAREMALTENGMGSTVKVER